MLYLAVGWISVKFKYARMYVTNNTLFKISTMHWAFHDTFILMLFVFPNPFCDDTNPQIKVIKIYDVTAKSTDNHSINSRTHMRFSINNEIITKYVF